MRMQPKIAQSRAQSGDRRRPVVGFPLAGSSSGGSPLFAVSLFATALLEIYSPDHRSPSPATGE